jgi:putative phosphoribosyl transferase
MEERYGPPSEESHIPPESWTNKQISYRVSRRSAVAMVFQNRVEAGKRLAEALATLGLSRPIVLAIPRGGVVVGEEVARELGAVLDIVVTRKIEAPGEPEYALGAVTQEGEAIIDRQAAESLGASASYLDAQVEKKRREVKERMEKFRGGTEYPDLRGRTVIIVDDGIATGSSVGAAVMSVKKKGPKEVVVGVPVAPRDAVETLEQDVDKVVCLETPGPFLAIGEFYRDFEQVSDEEVVRVLQRSRRRRAA